MSSITWLDFSESERQKMIEVISLFKERDTRDELGIASIRDSFADQLFPGTTTLQTRARYFLFVPWLFRHYEKTNIQSSRILARLKQDEIILINALIHSGETAGVIGQRSGVSLQRFPSSIYWAGLQRWGICRHNGTIDHYQRSLDRWYELERLKSQVDESDPVDNYRPNWDPDLPKRPADFPQKAVFSLTQGEAEYLKERLLLTCSDSLIPYLLEQTLQVEDSIHFPWFHPSFEIFPKNLIKLLKHARNFSETFNGASLLYNYLLSKLSNNNELVSIYEERLAQWQTMIAAREEILKSWNRAEFWEKASIPGVHIPLGCRSFVDEWLDNLLSNSKITRLQFNKTMIALVENREKFLKGQRSRFRSPRHLEMWSGASSSGQLDYRWAINRRMTNDIILGFSQKGDS